MATLNERMEFDHVVRVHEGGMVTDEAGVYAPEVHMFDDGSLHVDSGWELLDGYSGQYGYGGPVMHPSEFIGGRMNRDILETPGVYVTVVVTCDTEDEDGDNVAGWAVARKVEEAHCYTCDAVIVGATCPDCGKPGTRGYYVAKG